MITAEEMIAFEKDIGERFNRAEILYPIHLSKGNEAQLIEIFKDFKQGDWVFNSWRSHLHALLAGVPPEKVRKSILAGRSMTLCWPEHHFFCSAIVGGVIPIAVGVAWQIKQRAGNERVFLFVGDMTSQTGMALECFNYSRQHGLPVVWICEDNGKSVCTDTKDALGGFQKLGWDHYYQWDLSQHYPHAGAGHRVQF